jgi:hypothetical protein
MDLEKLLGAVDSIRAALEKCKTFTELENGFKAGKKELAYIPAKRKLFLNGKMILDDVTSFDYHFFHESISVMYNIELFGKEQFKGYVFLKGLIV